MNCLPPCSCVLPTSMNNDEQECRAFREIPDAIMSGKCDRSNPSQGDNGVCFQTNSPCIAEDTC